MALLDCRTCVEQWNKIHSPTPRRLHYSVALLLSLEFAYEREAHLLPASLRSRPSFFEPPCLSRRRRRSRGHVAQDFKPFTSIHYNRWDFKNEMKSATHICITFPMQIMFPFSVYLIFHKKIKIFYVYFYVFFLYLFSFLSLSFSSFFRLF